VVPNRLGDLIERGMETKPAMAISETFGQQARQTSRTGVLNEQAAEQRAIRPTGDPLDPDAPDIVGQTYREFNDLRDADKINERYGITPERADEIGVIATRDPRALATLPENEAQFVRDWDAANETPGPVHLRPARRSGQGG
jgi:hypothetical protein